jgi:hypothetical protein
MASVIGDARSGLSYQLQYVLKLRNKIYQRIRDNKRIDNDENRSKMSISHGKKEVQAQPKIFYSDGITKVGNKFIKNRDDNM